MPRIIVKTANVDERLLDGGKILRSQMAALELTKTRFISDEGHGTGCTLYVGGKGHKELCIYEKGKQQGMPESPWVRMEVRLYGKHVEGRAVPVDALRDPVALSLI
jgi:DNA relaxase NicK